MQAIPRVTVLGDAARAGRSRHWCGVFVVEPVRQRDVQSAVASDRVPVDVVASRWHSGLVASRVARTDLELLIRTHIFSET